MSTAGGGARREGVVVFNSSSPSGCLLCDEVQNRSPLSVRARLCDDPRANFLLESRSLLLLPDISPLVPGHSLLITKEHFASFAQAPEDCGEELRTFKVECAALVASKYSAPLLFEHGSASSRPRSGACVHHAHIHFLPLVAPVESWISEFGEVRRVDRPSRWADGAGARDYLAYEDQQGRSFLVSELESVPPCQFLRRRIAEHLLLREWQWELMLLRRMESAANAERRPPADAGGDCGQVATPRQGR